MQNPQPIKKGVAASVVPVGLFAMRDRAVVELRSRPTYRRVMIYVLAYPEFEPGVAAKIARFRSMHEPNRAKLVPPHVTLVFGLTSVRPTEFVAFCERAAECAHVLEVNFAATEIVYDPFEETHKLFLMISAGKDDLTALHERLYGGPHQSELDPAIPYRPHMTMATHTDRAAIERLDGSAMGAFPIPGVIRNLEVVELADKTLRSLRTVPLQQ